MPTVDISQDFSTPATGGASAYGFEDIDVTTGGGGPHFNLRPLVVASGVARASLVGFDTIVRHTTDMQSADHWAEADVVTGASIDGQYTGVSIRMSGAPKVWTWYKLEIWGQPDRVRIICLVNGVTRGEWYANQTINTNSTYTLRLEAVGSRIRGWVNGTLKFDFTDTNITSNTRAGMHVVPDTGNVANSGITAWRAQNFIDNSGVVPTGQFTINASNGRIIDPNGDWFKPTGFNAPSRPFPAPVSEGYWANQTYATGQSAAALAWGINMMRFIVWDPGGSEEVTRERQVQGLFRAIDEYIDAGIVCTWWCGEFTGGNPTIAQLTAGSFALEIMDRVISQYRTHPRREYIWLNPLNEPFEFLWTDGVTGPGAGWSTVWNWLYNRARAAGWDAMFIVDLPGYANGGALRIADSTIVETFLAGKTKCVVAWHNYGSGTDSEMTAVADAAVAKGIPVVMGEFGQHWDPALQTGGDAAGVEWVKNNSWTYGFGGLAWQGSGEPGLTFGPRQANGAPWWASTPALSEVGQLIYDRGTGGSIGGGPPDQEPTPPPVVNPPVVVAPATRRRQTRGRLTIGGAGGTVFGGRPRP